VYQVSIEPQGKAFVVNFAYGRRGSTMNTGTKTQTPVDYDSAKSIYDKLVREKQAKGYTEGPDGTPYQNTPKEDRVTCTWRIRNSSSLRTGSALPCLDGATAQSD
jgi:bifunctional non-homologous end joining protein LigD